MIVNRLQDQDLSSHPREHLDRFVAQLLGPSSHPKKESDAEASAFQSVLPSHLNLIEMPSHTNLTPPSHTVAVQESASIAAYHSRRSIPSASTTDNHTFPTVVGHRSLTAY